jgi:hypothetical protein
MRQLLACVLLVGCTPATFVFSPSVKGVVAKPDNCHVDIVTSYPSRDFQELGTLQFYNGTEPTSLDAFKKAVAKQVCEVGGDVALAVADSKGQYTKGSILAYTDSGAPAPPGKGPAAPEQQNDTEVPK